MTPVSNVHCNLDDPCIQATRRTYSELRWRGFTEADAFSAAVRVLRNHHPAMSLDQAYDIAGVWIDSALVA